MCENLELHFESSTQNTVQNTELLSTEPHIPTSTLTLENECRNKVSIHILFRKSNLSNFCVGGMEITAVIGSK